jgi:2-C-methyl-D-erythritol 4-phosphate cytidylyltransferase
MAKHRGDREPIQIAAIVPAAGVGHRFGAEGGEPSKQFRKLGGLPLLTHVLKALDLSSVQAVYVAVPPGQGAWVRRETVLPYGIRKVRAVLAGGATRGESVWCCVDKIPAKYNVLLVHDGARPLVTPRLIDEVAAAAYECGAALAAVPETDTVKKPVARSDTPGVSSGGFSGRLAPRCRNRV